MKKIELHVHLDGSIRPSTVSELLNMPIDMVKKKMIVSENTNDLTEYLTKFELPIKVMQTKENLKRVAFELSEDLKKDDVIYAEVRFAPQFHTEQGLSYDDVIQAVIDGFNMNSGIKINIILCMMRGASYENNLNTVKAAEKYLGNGVVALDLAGDEKKYKTSDYEKLFCVAKKKNIPFTIHAGEAAGASSVMDAILFGAKRIGHGIRVLEDEVILNELIESGITLEVCPTSNVQTKVVKSLKSHPIKKLLKKGVLVTVSTDNRTVSNISLKNEYDNLKKCFNFNEKDLLKMNINAVLSAFITDLEKKRYINMLKEDFYEDIHDKTR